jgi:hypothetical protein
VVKLFDSTFVLGSALVIASLVVAALALTRDDVPIIGSGALALVAVADRHGRVRVGGISQAPTLGWTAPAIIFGTVLGRRGAACSSPPVCSAGPQCWIRSPRFVRARRPPH